MSGSEIPHHNIEGVQCGSSNIRYIYYGQGLGLVGEGEGVHASIVISKLIPRLCGHASKEKLYNIRNWMKWEHSYL